MWYKEFHVVSSAVCEYSFNECRRKAINFTNIHNDISLWVGNEKEEKREREVKDRHRIINALESFKYLIIKHYFVLEIWWELQNKSLFEMLWVNVAILSVAVQLRNLANVKISQIVSLVAKHFRLCNKC